MQLHEYIKNSSKPASVGDCTHTERSSTRVHAFFEDETVNRQNYLQMLKNYFYSMMQRKRLNHKMIL